MNLKITYKEGKETKTALIEVQKGVSLLASIDNFLKYGIINNTDKNKAKSIKNLEIVYENGENQSQITERINNIILKVIHFVKNL